MSRALLDINVLIALLDADHVHHGRAQAWLASGIPDGWASCAITENGFVRILSQPRYPNAVPVAVAAERVRHARDSGDHAFWPCQVSVLDGTVDLTRVHGPSQLTDAYLLALAVVHDGQLVTLDRRMPSSAVPAAKPRHLTVI